MRNSDLLHDRLELTETLAGLAIRCKSCGRMWRAPDELSVDNSTYLAQHAFSHEPPPRRKPITDWSLDQIM